MGIEQGGWPTAHEILPAPIERVLGVTDKAIELARDFGRFVLRTPEVHPHMSEYFKPEYLPEPQDGEAYQPHVPYSKGQTAAHYVAMAEEARHGNPS